jgi:hypothetical protein
VGMDSHEHHHGRRVTVGVEPASALRARRRLLAVLAAAFPVRFAPLGRAGAEVAATIVFDEGCPDLEALGARAVPTLVLGAAGSEGNGPAETVSFTSSTALDSRLRGLRLPDRLDGPAPPPEPTARVLAEGPAGPAWALFERQAPVHVVRSSLPELGPEANLRDLLPERALALLALTQFLRTASEGVALAEPPLRAAFLFDDPNLRWPTYGFIDYHRLLEHAEAHGYHAAMAMVPLDGRLQHRATVELFRRNRDRLSLVFHGNNHVGQELMRAEDEAGALRLAAQAIRRVEGFESRYGLAVDRVMTPPHGMCSASVARALGAVGFDAICAIHPLPWAERPPASRPLAGWGPAGFAEGCAVVPRLHLGSSDAEIGLRAFLDQPLVFYGHHEDLSGGLDRLAEIANRVARLGAPRWSSLAEIAASNFASRRDGDALRVRPHSNRLRLRLPAGVRRLLVERPPQGGERLVGWSARAGAPLPFDAAHPVTGGAALELRLRRSDEISPREVPAPRWSPWPVLRKAAMEARDRTLPLRP